MAIDTRAKRSSAVFPLLPFRAQLPAPDGTVGQGDRQAVVFLYSGILATATITVICNFALTVSDILSFGETVSDIAGFSVEVGC